jgi:Ca2+-dependent lipid-binding protein
MELLDRDQKKRTSTQYNSRQPSWEEDFTFDIVSYNSDVLKFVLYSLNSMSIDSRFSKLLIRVCQLPPGHIIDGWYELRLTDVGVNRTASRSRDHLTNVVHDLTVDRYPGRVHLGLQVALKGTQLWQVAPFPLFRVVVTIIEARGVPKMDTFGMCDPYCFVSVLLSRLVYKTKVIKKTYTPVWQETTAFLLNNPNTDVLRITMRDEDTLADEDIGVLDIPLAGLLNQPEVDKWDKPKPVKGVKTAGELHYRIRVEPAPPGQYAQAETGATTESKLKQLHS